MWSLYRVLHTGLYSYRWLTRLKCGIKVHNRNHKRPPPACILGQPNTVHIPTSQHLQIHPNIIHPSTPRSTQWSPFLLLYFTVFIPKSTYLFTPRCRVLPEQLVKKFPAFQGTRRFITALTSVRHLSLSWVSPIHSTCPHPTSWRSILILSTHLHLCLPSGLLHHGFPTKTLYTPLTAPIRAARRVHLIRLDFKNHYWNKSTKRTTAKTERHYK